MSQTDRRPFETSSLLTFFRSSWRRSLRVCSLIIEGPFNYTNGPTVWPEGPTYGFITAPAAGYKKDVDCPAVPDDSPLKPLEGSAVNPYSMFSLEAPLDEGLAGGVGARRALGAGEVDERELGRRAALGLVQRELQHEPVAPQQALWC